MLRLDKDPNLDKDFFWDLRRDRIPLFRVLQLTEFLIPVLGEDGMITKLPVNRVPSKYEIQQVFQTFPDSIQVVPKTTQASSRHPPFESSNETCCCTVDSIHNLFSEKEDEVFIPKSMASVLSSSLSLSLPSSSLIGPMISSSSITPILSISYQQDTTWFRLGPRVIPQYALFFKKRGVLCTCRRGPYDSKNVPTIVNVLDKIANINNKNDINMMEDEEKNSKKPLRPLVHVGRLDLESEGLILLTNDGTFSRWCTSPAVGLKKTYRVLVQSKGRRRWVSQQQQEGDINRTSIHNSVVHELRSRLLEITDCVRVGETKITIDRDARSPLHQPGDLSQSTTKPFKSRAEESSSEFRAESCTVVDWLIEERSKVHKQQRISSSDTNIPAHSENENASTTIPTVLLALIDVEMCEGAKREVRRLMRSLDLVTLILARTKIGSLDYWQITCSTPAAKETTASSSSWDFSIPTTIPEALEKYREYTNISQKDKSSYDQQLEKAASPLAFRYLYPQEVDAVFAMVDDTVQD